MLCRGFCVRAVLSQNPKRKACYPTSLGNSFLNSELTHFHEEERLQSEEVQRVAKQNLEKGECWHKKLSIKEIVFGFQDNSIAILAVLAGVIGGSLQRGQILLAGLAAVIAGDQGQDRLHKLN